MHDPGVEYLAAEICYARFGVAIENITRAQADVIKQEARDRLAPVRTFLTPHQTEIRTCSGQSYDRG
jgi:hypothetical protein